MLVKTEDGKTNKKIHLSEGATRLHQFLEKGFSKLVADMSFLIVLP